MSSNCPGYQRLFDKAMRTEGRTMNITEENEALRARVAELEVALRHAIYGIDDICHKTGFADADTLVCVKTARAALAKEQA